ncbi:helix-turn-helix transcriptional regulator [Streptomyces luteireticuli]|uniref:Helix-turn-helix transcriptional regulator n=1 Tax=Streptomyces luteireticuli TaxID=173858 RepID=A0ABN0YKY0_9ACTN
MSDATPTLMRRRLGAILRTMRVRAGLNLVDSAKLLGLSGAPTLSKIENGKQRPELDRFFEVYGVEDAVQIAEVRRIARFAEAGRRKNLFAQYGDAIRAPFADFIELEEVAHHADTYAALVIPGLLQTVNYAHAVIEGSSMWSTAREVRTFTELRMKRQTVLTYRQGEAGSAAPLSMWCVLDEACLRRQVGGPAVLRGQLEHLLDKSELPNVDLQVLPFAAGVHTGIDGAYTVFRFDAGEPIVALEPLTTSIYLEEDSHVGRYESALGRLRERALAPDSSRDFIKRILKETQ